MRGSCFYRTAGLCLAAMLVVSAPTARAGPFGPGDLVVSRITVGGGNSAANVTLAEYTTAAGQSAPVQSIALPSTGAGVKLTQISIGFEGALSLSSNGQYLTLAGYNAVAGTANVFSSTAQRVIARVDVTGTPQFSTMTDYSGIPIHSAASTDGSQVWVGADNGVRSYTFGSATGTSVTPNDARVLNVTNGQLYGSQSNSIYRTNTPLPTTTSATTALATLPIGSEARAFVLLDRSGTVAGVDTLYIADQSGGLRKYSFNGSTWTARGTISGGLSGITGVVSGGSAALYVTTGNGATGGNLLRSFTDTAAFNATISGSYTTLATAPAGEAFRGVAFTPVAIPEPGTLLLGGTVAAGAFGVALRRRLRRKVTVA